MMYIISKTFNKDKKGFCKEKQKRLEEYNQNKTKIIYLNLKLIQQVM